jgi:hypothetical protein
MVWRSSVMRTSPLEISPGAGAILHCARLEGNSTQYLLLIGIWAGALISIGG